MIIIIKIDCLYILNMLAQFKKIYMMNIYNSIKERLEKVAEENNLKYEELEELYLKDIKEFLELDKIEIITQNVAELSIQE